MERVNFKNVPYIHITVSLFLLLKKLTKIKKSTKRFLPIDRSDELTVPVNMLHFELKSLSKYFFFSRKISEKKNEIKTGKKRRQRELFSWS